MCKYCGEGFEDNPLDKADWAKTIREENNRHAIRQERNYNIFAARVEDEFAIDLLLWKLIHGIAYVEEGR